jgi:hypothetical protein
VHLLISILVIGQEIMLNNFPKANCFLPHEL